MALKDKASLASDISTNIEDNTSGSVTPADVRARLLDMLDSGGGPGVVLVEATTARTLALTDAYAHIRCTNSAATAITVPPDSSVAFPDGVEITFTQSGTGQVTLVAGAGVTIQSLTTFKTSAQYALIGLKKMSANTWKVVGELATS